MGFTGSTGGRYQVYVVDVIECCDFPFNWKNKSASKQKHNKSTTFLAHFISPQTMVENIDSIKI